VLISTQKLNEISKPEALIELIRKSHIVFLAEVTTLRVQ